MTNTIFFFISFFLPSTFLRFFSFLSFLFFFYFYFPFFSIFLPLFFSFISFLSFSFLPLLFLLFLTLFFLFSFPVFDFTNRVFEAISYATSYVRASNNVPMEPAFHHPLSNACVFRTDVSLFPSTWRIFLACFDKRWTDVILDEKRYLHKADIKYIYSRGV